MIHPVGVVNATLEYDRLCLSPSRALLFLSFLPFFSSPLSEKEKEEAKRKRKNEDLSFLLFLEEAEETPKGRAALSPPLFPFSL